MARHREINLNESSKPNKPPKINSARKSNSKKATDVVDSADSDFAARCKVLGENIRYERKVRGFSIENLAEYLELSTSYVGLLERGARCPSLKNLFNICDLFSSTPNNLILANNSGSNKISVSEQKHSIQKNNYDAVISLLQNLNEAELKFVADILKNMKNLQKNNS